mmetsp:Transcript_35339/g.62048  ORF Transcript_35339/g.62048 Transcript_35339/m.62048 type:complete len:224 (+) Transcript_35339:225-896(+)
MKVKAPMIRPSLLRTHILFYLRMVLLPLHVITIAWGVVGIMHVMGLTNQSQRLGVVVASAKWRVIDTLVIVLGITVAPGIYHAMGPPLSSGILVATATSRVITTLVMALGITVAPRKIHAPRPPLSSGITVGKSTNIMANTVCLNTVCSTCQCIHFSHTPRLSSSRGYIVKIDYHATWPRVILGTINVTLVTSALVNIFQRYLCIRMSSLELAYLLLVNSSTM